MPDGQRYIEGVTPKALPAPDGDKDQGVKPLPAA
jgi:hypothetical protein